MLLCTADLPLLRVHSIRLFFITLFRPLFPKVPVLLLLCTSVAAVVAAAVDVDDDVVVVAAAAAVVVVVVVVVIADAAVAVVVLVGRKTQAPAANKTLLPFTPAGS